MGWSGRAPAPASKRSWPRGRQSQGSQKLNSAIAVIGIDIGKNSFHVVGHDLRGAIVLRQKWSRGQVETRLANLPPCPAVIEEPNSTTLIGVGDGASVNETGHLIITLVH
jgi:hypothetical protein